GSLTNLPCQSKPSPKRDIKVKSTLNNQILSHRSNEAFRCGLFKRWTNANPEGAYRLQPFGAEVSDYREVEGYRLPFHVEAGNMFGTDEYFPFFIADITDIRFPVGQA
ncbi:DUF6544 family protein, partial [Roseovarius sp. A46]|uniref:DUF6920 family protein n=1 Tax=Roseovarius sp. A46 TaxID=2109331 RepID=UPI003220468B